MVKNNLTKTIFLTSILSISFNAFSEELPVNVSPTGSFSLNTPTRNVKFGGVIVEPVLMWKPKEFISPTKINVAGEEKKLKNIWELGVKAEKITEKRIGIGLYISTGSADTERTSSGRKYGLDIVTFGLYGTYYIPLNIKNDFYPYVSVGILRRYYSPSNNKYNNIIEDQTKYGPYFDVGLYISKNGKLAGKLGLGSGGVSVGLSYGKMFVKDSDLDGIYDDKDMCPNTQQGTIVDATGCPKDSDKDKVYDKDDLCPNTPIGVKVDSSGCPIDSDADGVPDYKDKCPNTPLGTKVDENGCPLKEEEKVNTIKEKKNILQESKEDSDKDGIINQKDKCPNTPIGFEVDENGCFVKTTLNIQFDYNSSEIKEIYYPTIEKVANFLKEHPTIKVEIQGHTDNIGSDEFNLKLSQRRADAVKNLLVNKYGISPNRLISKGYGEREPIAPNDTEEGRAKNRRAVIKIIKQNN